MKKKEQEDKFQMHLQQSEDHFQLKYKILLQKAKILYFDDQLSKKKEIRKNSTFLPNFNVFKIRRKPGASGSRNIGQESKNLKKLAKNIIKLFYDNSKREFTLEVISCTLDVDKRKIYDLVNILNSLDII